MNLEVRKENNLSIIKDPFSKRCIRSIHMFCFPKHNTLEWSASIEFQNGLTEGKQNFKGRDFEDITLQMKSFMEQLNAQE